jgi:hypothetical protein
MDDIRREMTGSISDQSKNPQVFKESVSRVEALLAEETSVYYSATNLGNGEKSYVIKTINQLVGKKNFVQPVVVFLEDSLNKDLCLSRVKTDLQDGKDRSNVPEDIVEKQYEKFVHLHDSSWIHERSTLGVMVFDFSTSKTNSAEQIEKLLVSLDS